MSHVTSKPSDPSRSVFVTLLPIMAAVLAGFVIIGLALPVLPLHVHDDLGFGTFVVGLVAGAQFAASLISRIWAGSFSDKHGAKLGVVTGLIAAVVSGLLVGAEVHARSPPVLAELPETGERFEGLLPPVVTSPAFAIRKPAVAVFTPDGYVATVIMTARFFWRRQRAV